MGWRSQAPAKTSTGTSSSEEGLKRLGKEVTRNRSSFRHATLQSDNTRQRCLEGIKHLHIVTFDPLARPPGQARWNPNPTARLQDRDKIKTYLLPEISSGAWPPVRDKGTGSRFPTSPGLPAVRASVLADTPNVLPQIISEFSWQRLCLPRLPSPLPLADLCYKIRGSGLCLSDN